MSLEKTCIKLIVQEFERFYLTVVQSNDKTLSIHFEFLQRTYSLELITELSDKRKLKDKYLQFLLNDHLKVLDEKWLRNTCYQNNMKDVIPRLQNLSKILLPFTCSDEILENIAKFCPCVTEIYASYSPITDTGLISLYWNEKGAIPCPKLKKLSIVSAIVTENCLANLILNLTSLEEIDHKNVPQVLYTLHKNDLINLAKIPIYNLIHLDLCKYRKLPYFTDFLKICLTACPKLKSIALYVSNKEQLDLFTNTSLEQLDIGILNKKIDVNQFLKHNGRNLISLFIYNCNMSLSCTAQNCPKLQRLFLDSVGFIDNEESSQAMFRSLIECTFKKTTVDDSTNKAIEFLLSSSPKLERLNFTSCYLSSETKTSLLKCCEKKILKYITFFCTFVEMEILKDILVRCSSLKTLKLEHCYFEMDESLELANVVKSLPNKPEVYVDSVFVNDYCDERFGCVDNFD